MCVLPGRNSVTTGYHSDSRNKCADGVRRNRSSTCEFPTKFSTWPRNSKVSKEALGEVVVVMAAREEATMEDAEAVIGAVADAARDEAVVVEEEHDIDNGQRTGFLNYDHPIPLLFE